MNIVTKKATIDSLINKSSNIVLMAHTNLDLDAINSCICMGYYVESFKKKAYIIVDDEEFELGVKKVLDMENNIPIIKSKKIDNIIDEDSLLIILDTSKEKLVQAPDVINKFKYIVNIDHHDKNDEVLKSTLSIIDTTSSSTCEMLTMLFIESNFVLKDNVPTLLLSGIVLDTNHYTLKTNSNTFLNSSYLIDHGADLSLINELLKQDISAYIKRQKIITSVRVINKIALGHGTQRSIYKREELAKSADSLLSFSRIKASFVIAKVSKDVVGISARSNGEVNVGKILEDFGGGGSVSEAATIIEETNIEEVINKLKKVIKNI